MIETRRLGKQYGSTWAIRDLDIHVGAGEVLALLGPNGAGKTTTLNLLLGFIATSAGEAIVAGVSVAADPLAARRRVAYVPEQVGLYPHLSGVENLAYFMALAGERAPQHLDLVARLGTVGLSPGAAERRAATYSKGMRQRVVLALAAARRAAVVLLDEPTSGLDPMAADELAQLIRDQRDAGAAVLLVTHDLAAASAVADRIGIMRGGQLVAIERTAGLGDRALTTLYYDHCRAAS